MQEVRNLLADGRVYEEVVGEAHKACLPRAPGVYGVVGVGVALAVRVWSLRCLYAAEAEFLLPYPVPVKLALPVGYVDANTTSSRSRCITSSAVRSACCSAPNSSGVRMPAFIPPNSCSICVSLLIPA